MILSERLEKIVESVPECECAADIGCDHGYVSIEIIKRNKTARVIAADVNSGPLSKARKNISAEGLSDRIETVLSDGLLSIDIPDCIVISGMGGRLMRDILSFTPTGPIREPSVDESTEAGRSHNLSLCRYLVLSPQSEPEIVRRFVTNAGFSIIDELMVKDSGKFYVIMICENMRFRTEKQHEIYESREDFLYGRRLIENKDKVFREYLDKELKKKLFIISEIEKNVSSSKAAEELAGLKEKVDDIKKILSVYDTKKG